MKDNNNTNQPNENGLNNEQQVEKTQAMGDTAAREHTEMIEPAQPMGNTPVSGQGQSTGYIPVGNHNQAMGDTQAADQTHSTGNTSAANEASGTYEEAPRVASSTHPLPPIMDGNSTYYHETIKEKKGRNKKKSSGGFGKFIAGLTIVSLVGGGSLGAGYAFTAPLAQKLYNDKMGIEVQDTTVGGDNGNGASYAQSTGYVAPLYTNNSIADIA
ncbi:MAG: hypothetical protein RSD98_03245, partial [Niameybacter sp.]